MSGRVRSEPSQWTYCGGSLARRGLREQLRRIQELTVGENLVMQMRAGRAARRADIPDHLAALDRLSGLGRERTQVPVARRQTEPVLHDQQVAVVAGVGGGFH